MEEGGDDGGDAGNSRNFQSNDPIMGGLVQTSRGWVAFTSGKPLYDWSGRDQQAVQLQSHDNPSQWRYAKDDGYHYRCTALDDDSKFTHNGDFALFGERLFKCFKERGQESITYAPVPREPERMGSVLTDFVWFTKNSIRASMKIKRVQYDEYDKDNDTVCIQALMASLDVKLKKELMTKITLDNCFCEVWLELNQIVCSTSVTRFAKLRTDIRDCLPTRFGPQNMVDMANTQLADACKLYKAKQYDPNPTTLELIDSFLLADGSQIFTYKMHMFRSSLRIALESIQSMTDIDNKNNHMKLCSLHFEDICRRVKDLYRKELDNNCWNPAKKYKDHCGPPRNYGAYTAYPHDEQPSAHLLEQYMHPTSNAPTRWQEGCHLCESLSHWKSTCHKNTTQSPSLRSGAGPTAQPQRPPSTSHGRSSPQRSSTSGRHLSNGSHDGRGGRRFSLRPSNNSWRSTPPTDGQTQKLVDGCRFYWGQTCCNWTTTHETHQHTGSSSSKAGQNRQSHRSSSHSNNRWSSHPGRHSVCHSPCANIGELGTHGDDSIGSFSHSKPHDLDPSAWFCSHAANMDLNDDLSDLNLEPTPVPLPVPTAYPSIVDVSNALSITNDSDISIVETPPRNTFVGFVDLTLGNETTDDEADPPPTPARLEPMDISPPLRASPRA